MDASEEFRSTFRLGELTIAEAGAWTWSVRPVPATLGAGVVSLARSCERLADVTSEEMADLAVAARLVEDTLRGAFAYDKINWLLLMMVDRQVHFHVLPRYAESRPFLGLEWVDAAWPKPPDILAGADRGTDDVLFALRDHLRAAADGR